MHFKVTSLLAAAFSLGVVQAASSADMPAKAPVYKAPVAVATNWSGFYLGVNGGFAWSRGNGEHVDWTSALFDPGPNFPGSTSSKGIFGAQAGYNWQVNPSWLLGLEVDFDSAKLGQSNAAPLLFLARLCPFQAA